jgi:cell wall-associated NlpC family hydrolase
VKGRLRFLVVTALAVATSIASVYAQEQKETLGDKLKKLFVRPTPTPTPRKPRKRNSPTASPTETPASSASPSSEAGATTIPPYGETPLPRAEPSASIETLAPVEAKTPETQYFEPVRPINPGPRGRSTPRIINTPQTTATSIATETPLPEVTEEESPDERPTPSLPVMTGSTSSPVTETAAPETAIPLEAETIDSKDYPEDVRKMIGLGCDLAKRRLNYKYASADPANGGLDCSGFIYYVFTKSGVKNVPRDAREQYVWVRKAGNFQAVLAHGEDTFELDALRPGDVLFWANTSGASREPEITQTMIYIGRDKTTKQRLMIGATERGTYKDRPLSGVGVFDFDLKAAEQEPGQETDSVFVGYGRFPDLTGN